MDSKRLTSSLYSAFWACLGCVNGCARAWADEDPAVEMSDEKGWKGTALDAAVELDPVVGSKDSMRGMTRKSGSTG
jgi:hypothetical protein